MNDKLLLDKETMQALGYRVVDMIVNHITELPEKSATKQKTRAELETIFREKIPDEGMDPMVLLDTVEKEVFANIMHIDHPRFFAFVPGPNNYIGALADFLTAGFNVIACDWLEASAAAQIEMVVIDWLRELFKLPDTAGGIFVSGGSMGNLMSMILAIHHKKQAEKVGVIYCSEQTHSSVERGVTILGKDRLELRKIQVDSSYQMDIIALKKAIAKDKKEQKQPIAIIATAGTTNTGAIDNLSNVAKICKTEDLWFHVDAAYGGAAILDDRQRHLYNGIEQVDSMVINPHKWLFQPIESACFLVRQKRQLKDVFYIMPEYLKDMDLSAEEINYANYGIQLTRSFKALKLWMSLKAFGLNNFKQAIKTGVDLAVLAEKELMKYDNWMVVSPPKLAIINFQYRPPLQAKEQTNLLNKAIIDEIVKTGFAMISSTLLKGQLVIRLCIINPRTTEKDIKETIKQLNQIAIRLSEEFP